MGWGPPAAGPIPPFGCKVSFSVKATMYPGTVTFKVTKAGYTTAYLTRKVRLP